MFERGKNVRSLKAGFFNKNDRNIPETWRLFLACESCFRYFDPNVVSSVYSRTPTDLSTYLNYVRINTC